MKICAQTVGHSTFSSVRRIAIVTSILGVLGLANSLQATAVTPVTYTWTGAGTSNNLYTSENWADESAPPSSSWDSSLDIEGIFLLFENSRRGYLTYTDLYATKIEFRSIDQTYSLDNQSANTTHIGSGGIIYNPTRDIESRINGPVRLHASQVWNIAAGRFIVTGEITDNGISSSYNNQIEKTGDGELVLESSSGHYSWGGGLKLTAGEVTFRSTSSSSTSSSGLFGTGTLTFNGGTLNAEFRSSTGEGISITNNIVSNGLISLETHSSLNIDNADSSTNFFRLDADTTIEIQGRPVYVEKDITESGGARKLTLDAKTALILTGANSWTGGTHVKSGALVFGGTSNTPSTGDIKIDSDGYAGIGVSNNVASFLGKIDKTNSTGSIGFDSDVENSIDTFSSAVDLTGFNSDIRLGSATMAILTGTITPQGTDYRFGGGGGTLYVGSLLTDSITVPAGAPGVSASAGSTPRNIVASSPSEAPLTVQLQNSSNSFSGTVQADNSAIIFGDGVSLPGSTANFSMNASSYIGTAHNPSGSQTEIPISTFLGHFPTNSPGIIGFDITSTTTSTRTVDLTGVDLTGFTGGVALGTASALRDTSGDITGAGINFTGTIGADASGVHRFSAFKGAALEISGALTGSSLIIGNPDSPGSFGDRNTQQRSAVLISGNNTGKLASGTTLYGGELKVGQATGDGTIGTDATNALGSGAITVTKVNFNLSDGEDDDAPEPALTVSADNIIINNAISLGTDLIVGDSRDFTLGGVISGNGGLSVGEDSDDSLTLTLAGNNTHTGGVSINNSNTVNFTHDSAAGMSELEFDGESSGIANFTTANPTIYGLQSHNSGARVNLNFSGNRIFTINQTEGTTFNGSIHGTGASTIVKEGTGMLQFQNGTIYSSGISDGQGNDVALEIKNGTFVFGEGSSLNSGAIKVNGGTLAVQGGRTVSNSIAVSSGRIAGFGTYGSSVSIGAGAILSPGLDGHGLTGSMTFSHLELNSGGTYEFHVQDPDGSNGDGRDHINVTSNDTLVINSTSADPFTIKVLSLNSSGEAGMLSGIDTDNGIYSWTLFSFDSLSIPGTSNIFNANLFSLDLTGFTSDISGDFSLFKDSNNLVLGFTPVPEPSTYAMMALGLGMIGFMAWRRRSQS